jgi:hypothetical protein
MIFQEDMMFGLLLLMRKWMIGTCNLEAGYGPLS